MYELPEGYKGRLLHAVDCTGEIGPEWYFQNRETHIVSSSAGRYREAGDEPLARFGYRFSIDHPGRPHMAVIGYPDDRRRYMCINDGTCYDLTTGVFTGVAYPLSGAMERIENIFWPRWKDCSIVFMTWGEGEPAAVQGFSVYELDGLPPAAVPAAIGQGRRSIGIQYEDPCGKGASEGARTFDEWLERHIQYARHTGQNRLVYPINWYHGPQFPSQSQPADAFDMVVSEDRRQYSRSTTHPPDWIAGLLRRFEQENLEFVGSMTLLRLGNLLRDMNIDIDDIGRGGDTYNNMLWNDNVQSSCGDWTALYNARNYRQYVSWQQQGRDMADFPWAYGEKRGDFHGGPMFNPLHPEVRRQVLEYMEEIGRRYGRYRSFKGVSVNMWHATMLWFGSLHAGYDDYTAALFEKETGITAGVGPDDPHRFSKRYEYFTFKCRPAWIAWRCGKIRDLIVEVRDALRQGNAGLTLTLTFWNETSKAQVLGMPGVHSQLHARTGDYEFFREGGADLLLLGREEGIELAVETNHQRDRGWDTRGVKAPLECGFMFRDHDFLDGSRNAALRSAARPCGFIFNCWVEAWGEHRWFDCEPGDPNVDEVSRMYDGRAEYVHRMNSYYPEDGFWWDSQLRITSAFPAGIHFMEHYAHALAEYDALSITRGGLYLDKAHSRETLAFAAAYRALPALRFADAGPVTDPVAVRKLRHEGRLFLYMVNREPYGIPVRVTFNADALTLTDEADGSAVPCGRTAAFHLAPYGLRVFTAGGDADIAGWSFDIGRTMARAYQQNVRELLGAFAAAGDAGRTIPGMDRMRDEVAEALEGKRYSWLRHALTSYIACKARETAGLRAYPEWPGKAADSAGV